MILDKVHIFSIAVEQLFTFVFEVHLHLVITLIIILIFFAFAVIECVVIINIVEFLFKTILFQQFSVVFLCVFLVFSLLCGFLRFVLPLKSVVPVFLKLRVQIECLSNV